MNNKKAILATAKSTIEHQATEIGNLKHLINNQFAEAVDYIYQSSGRVVFTGIGKSAIIAMKIVATLNSTGTPAIFMHAADALHGDLGIIQQEDTIICISKSGNTPEIKTLIPLLKKRNNKLIAITGNKNSFLANQADFLLDTTIEKEACPNNLAPTTSTTAQLVMGDALSVCLLQLKEFTPKDFAQYHPGGALGKKLYLRIADVISSNLIPKVSINTSVKETIVEISEKLLGITAVLEKEKLVGVITDGDIRRMLNKYDNISSLTAKDIMSPNPKTIDIDVLAVNALEHMENHAVTQLVVTQNNRYVGIIHLHHLIKEGIM